MMLQQAVRDIRLFQCQKDTTHPLSKSVNSEKGMGIIGVLLKAQRSLI